MRGPLRLLAFSAILMLPLLSGCVLARSPVDQPVVTSPFGLRWSGILPRTHHGVDLRAPVGTQVRTMAAGQVRFAGWMNGYGNVIWIDHRGHLLTAYAHLSEILVSPGATVTSGQVVGLSGNTGTSTAPHLHFEVWQNGRPVDPIGFLGLRP